MEYYLAITRNEQLKQHTETLDESQNLFAEWMKPEKKKKYMSCDSIFLSLENTN